MSSTSSATFLHVVEGAHDAAIDTRPCTLIECVRVWRKNMKSITDTVSDYHILTFCAYVLCTWPSCMCVHMGRVSWESASIHCMAIWCIQPPFMCSWFLYLKNRCVWICHCRNKLLPLWIWAWLCSVRKMHTELIGALNRCSHVDE